MPPSDKQRLLDWFSPSIFGVVPLAKSIPLIKDAWTKRFEKENPKVLDAVQRVLRSHGMSISIGQNSENKTTERTKTTGPNGLHILQVYFAQILFCPESLLDMRYGSFQAVNKTLYWNPLRLSYKWDPQFIGSIQRIYLGHYSGDPVVFRAGLKDLSLDSAEPLVLSHFGPGGQNAVVFSRSHFLRSGRDLFLHCVKNGIRLHPDFLPFGLLLSTLYENLSRTEKPHDVRKAFLSIAG